MKSASNKQILEDCIDDIISQVPDNEDGAVYVDKYSGTRFKCPSRCP